jgi:hypothetical protein
MMTHVRFSGYVPSEANRFNHGEREAGKSAAAPLPEAAVGSPGRRQTDTAARSGQTAGLASTSGMMDITGQKLSQGPGNAEANRPSLVRWVRGITMSNVHHILDVGIPSEMGMIRGGMKLPLKIMKNDSQRRRTEQYVWRCPACVYTSSAPRIGREQVARHIIDFHAMVQPNAAFQEGKNLKRHPRAILRDILRA